MTPIAIQIARTTLRVNIPHFQTRSTLEINFIAAATSRKPIATLTEFIHPPARGSCAIHLRHEREYEKRQREHGRKSEHPDQRHLPIALRRRHEYRPDERRRARERRQRERQPHQQMRRCTPLPSPSCVA